MSHEVTQVGRIVFVTSRKGETEARAFHSTDRARWTATVIRMLESRSSERPASIFDRAVSAMEGV